MKKIFGSKQKKLGEGVAAASQVEDVLDYVQPSLLFLLRKVFRSASTKVREERSDMYTMSLGDWPRRQRHPAGVGNQPKGKVRAERVIIEGDLLCYSEEEEEEKVGVYVGEAPVSRQHNYFEVEILLMGINGVISVGLCLHRYPLHKLPGWAKDSVGYHADDGRLYKSKATGVVFGPKCGPGDRMGCGVKYELISPGKDPDILPVFFTKNGKEVGCVHVSVPIGGLFPCVGLGGTGDAVRLIPHHLWPPDEDTHMAVDSGEDDWKKLHNLRVNGQLLEYCGRGSSHKDMGLAQGRLPLNTTTHYFQLEILDPGRYCFITIGLTKKNYPQHRHPGWNKGSIAYHADDGYLFEGNTMGLPFGPSCDKGDVMGCGIIFRTDCQRYCSRCGGECPSEENCDDNSEGEGDELNGDDFLSCVLHYSDRNFEHHNFDRQDMMVKRYKARHGPYQLLMRDQAHQSWADLLSDSEEGDDAEREEENGEDIIEEKEQNMVQVFFTHNGKMIGRREVALPRGGFYPSVSMGSLHECVKVDMHPMTG